MRTLFILFDSLNRHSLETYGGNIKTPNIKRFSDRAVTFDNHYVGSMPCMPARRDIHTGRVNFLHRSWGPLEPYDESFSEILRKRGTYTHLLTDHYHYFEDGGSTFHSRYTTWDFIRGQEWDTWKAVVEPPLDAFKDKYHGSQYEDVRQFSGRLQNMLNRTEYVDEQDFPLVKCFDQLFEFLDTNKGSDDWLFQLECFDPHEPFQAPQRFRDLYPTDYQGPILDWPRYREVQETEEEVREMRANYAALLTMVDEYFGKLIDYMDEHDMWKDTCVILTTDHGVMLGEHDWWAKNRQPFYQEISHIPMIVWHPDHADQAGQRRTALTQTQDLMPTLLELHGITELPTSVEGKSLIHLMAADGDHHEAVIYGLYGAATNVTDGRYTYFRYPTDFFNQEIYEYTLIPLHTKSFFQANEFDNAEFVRSFSFTGDYPVMKLPARKDAKRPPGQGGPPSDLFNQLYDVTADPDQIAPIEDKAIEAAMTAKLLKCMQRNEAPAEAYTRLGLEEPV
ncbi:MAG: sulfatase [Pseudomonadota bacterium]